MTDAIDIIHRRYFADRPDMLRLLEQARMHDQIARKALALRKRAGVSPARLARLAGVKAADITSLEESDYSGDPLMLLQRIAAALNHRLEIRAVVNRTSRRRKPKAA